MKDYDDYDYNDTPRGNRRRPQHGYESGLSDDFDDYDRRDDYDYWHNDPYDYDERYDGEYDDDYDAGYGDYTDYDNSGYSQPTRPAPRQGTTAQRPAEPPSRQHRAAQRPAKRRQQPDYEEYDAPSPRPYNASTMEKASNFRRRHPVLMNFIYIILASTLLIWMMLWFLDFWTFHGQERVVPDVKGQAYASAEGNVDLAGLRAVISDSVFDNYSRPGTVVEQTPIAGARIKKGGTVYLTTVAFSPKLITVPDFYNVSVRQARSMFEGAGIKEIREVSVISEYRGLVLGAKFNGVALQPGARIPISAIVTLEVGSGLEEAVETGIVTDTLAIDETIDELNIE